MISGLDDSPILEDIRFLAEDRRVPIREVGRKAFDALADTQSCLLYTSDAADE